MKDDALKALKRSARAILKDELAAMRKELKELRSHNVQLTTAVYEQRTLLTRERDSAVQRFNEIRTRASKAEAWAQTHALPQGNRVAHCLAQWVNAGCSGPGFGIVHPFDRWGISPKP